MTIDISQIITEYGAYQKNRGQSTSDIYKVREDRNTFKNAFQNRVTNDTRVELAEAEITELLQAYQDDFTTKGTFSATPRTILLDQYKVDLKMNPNTVVQSWLGFLSTNSLDRGSWPLVKYIMEVYVASRVEADLNKAQWGGEKGTITAGAATTALAAMDGLKKKINDGITASAITPIATGALNTDPETCAEQLEDFVASVPELYKMDNMQLNVAPNIYHRYRKGTDSKYNANYDRLTDTLSVQQFPNIKIVAQTAMAGSDKIWMTPEGNAVRWTKGVDVTKDFRINEFEPRMVHVYTDAFETVDFIQQSLVFTNDVETA
ncbi:MAG: hypothetical protein ACRBFS_22855 [Aureispira sp.]